MREAAVVIDVQVREDDAFDIEASDAQRAQLWTDFLFAFETKRDLPSMIGMQRPARFEQMHARTRVDDDHALRMVDDPGIRRQPACPVPVGHQAQSSSQTTSPAFHLRWFDPHATGLDRVELHAFTRIDRTTSE